MQPISIETITVICLGIKDVFVYCLLEQLKPLEQKNTPLSGDLPSPFHAYTCTVGMGRYAFSALQNNVPLDFHIYHSNQGTVYENIKVHIVLTNVISANPNLHVVPCSFTFYKRFMSDKITNLNAWLFAAKLTPRCCSNFI